MTADEMTGPRSLPGLVSAQEATIAELQAELLATNQGVVALSLELESYRDHLEMLVSERTNEIANAQAELQRTNSDLMLLTMELDARVAERTEELTRSNEALRREVGERIAVAEQLRRTSEQRRVGEVELERYRDHLEDLVAQRTAELAAAQQEAEQANRAKSAFLASMSHELRTPLNAILGFSKLLAEDPVLAGTQREYVNLINSSGQHLLALINDILDVSKIEAGRATAELAAFDLPALVADVCAMMGARVAAKGLVLVSELAPDLPRHVVSDAGRARQMLLNLLANAVNYTNTGSVTLKVGTEPGWLVFVVSDTGVGIASQDLSRVFESFTQVGEAGARQGSGLGLTICRQLAGLLGGSITVDSVLGVGSDFSLRLPLQLAQPGQVPTHTATGGKRAFALAAGQPQFRALVVDDRVENALLLRRILERAGFQTQVAYDGAAGVSAFQQFTPHVVFMDWLMPVMDGLEATKRIRGLASGRDAVVFAVTAVAFPAEHVKLIDAGVDEVINKLYEPSDIFTAIARHLPCRFVSDDGAGPTSQPDATLDLAELPAQFRSELAAALLELDAEKIEKAISDVARSHPELGVGMRRLTDSYQYDVLLALVAPETG